MTRVLVALLAVLALVASGCGDDTKAVTDKDSSGNEVVRTVPDVKFAKTKFVLHAGLGAGAVKRYIVDPYQEGQFKKGADKRKRTIVKAAIAGAFAVREFKLARNAALSSDVLRKRLVGPLDKMIDQLGSATDVFKGGSFNPTAIIGAAGTLATLKQLADGDGAGFAEKFIPIPGIGG